MRHSGTRPLVVAVLAGAALLATPLAALATFATNIVGPGPYAGAGITVFDNGPGDSDPALRSIVIIAGVGLPAIPGLSLSVDTSLTNAPGGPPFSVVDIGFILSSVLRTGGTIQITTSSQDFTYPVAGAVSELDSSIGGTITGTGSVTSQQWVNLSNALFGLGPVTPGVQGPFTGTSFSDSAQIIFTSNTPYSITDRLTLALGANSVTSGDLASRVVPVPEPATLGLLGAGLLGLGAAGWRRRQA